MFPGGYIGAAIMGLNDSSGFKTLAENIRKHFIADYIEKNM